MIARRQLLHSLLAAPFIVAAPSLMRVRDIGVWYRGSHKQWQWDPTTHNWLFLWESPSDIQPPVGLGWSLTKKMFEEGGHQAFEYDVARYDMTPAGPFIPLEEVIVEANKGLRKASEELSADPTNLALRSKYDWPPLDLKERIE